MMISITVHACILYTRRPGVRGLSLVSRVVCVWRSALLARALVEDDQDVRVLNLEQQARIDDQRHAPHLCARASASEWEYLLAGLVSARSRNGARTLCVQPSSARGVRVRL